MTTVTMLKSIKIQVKSGQTYYWCSCGLSLNQPFCDDSHINSSDCKPVLYKADEDKIVSFCGCKHSKKSYLCDGSHKFL